MCIRDRLEGEYILPVRNADWASGVPYIVTDVANNGTLTARIPAEIGVEISTAVGWTRQACQGVSRLHDHNLVHRDIKPDNLFLDERGDILVGDLGLAQFMDSHGFADAAGTPTTMAPEVVYAFMTGDPRYERCYSEQSDVYSLGATLFWLIAGHEPHRHISTFADLWNRATPDLWDHAPHVPQGLRDVVNTSIARDPGQRYDSPAQLDAALGGRVRPSRSWRRIRPHSGHTQCFEGTKGTSVVEVCAEPDHGSTGRLRIAARHQRSGRAIARVTRVVRSGALSAALRSAFRAIN